MNKEPKQLDLFVPESESEPPSTNRGVTVQIHWLAITFFADIKTAMTHFLREFIGYDIEDEMEWSEHFFNTQRGARGYRALYAGPENTRLYGFPHTGNYCHLEIPGQVLELYGTEHAIKYLKSLIESEIEFRCTRIDIAFDHVPFTPKDCYDAWQRGDVVTKCHKNSWDWRENAEGNTLYIGSRKSERFIRIYDRRGFTRLELVFKGQWSENFVVVITEIHSEKWITQCIGYLRDFIDLPIHNNIYSWWSFFISNTNIIKIERNNCTSNNLEQKILKYFEHIKPTLYVIKYGLNINLDVEVEKVSSLIQQKHIRKIQLLQKITNKHI